MKLAVNYTPQANALLKAGQVQFDLYKCPDWENVLMQAQQHKPVYVHFPIHAGRNATPPDWEKIDKFLRLTDTHFVNIHLAPYTPNFPGMEMDTRDPVWRERLIERVMADVQSVVEKYGKAQVILENVPWDPAPQYAIPRPIIMPEVIRDIVHESGCGLLLDTAHALIAAKHLEIDAVEYINIMPGDVLREIHVTGTRFNTADDVWEDHFAMREEDWELAAHVLEKVKCGVWAAPEIVALEYGGVGPMFEWRSESDVLAVELPRLAGLVNAAKQEIEPQR